MEERVRFEALDGFSLAGTWHPASADPARPAVLVAGAMGVPESYYLPFARHLAASGLSALTFDYRGMGASRTTIYGRDAQMSLSMHDWGEKDLAGGLRWIGERAPGAPLLVAGHSAGGQLLGLAPGADRVRALLAVAAQKGYWKLWRGIDRLGMFGLWHLGIPVVTRALGYLPMGGMAVPGGVAREWARWGRHPDYLLSYVRARGLAGYDRFDAPLRAYAIADDRYAPPATVEGLLAMYPRARSELKVVRPSELGVSKIGHFGFFRERFKDSLWREAVAWLSGHAETR